MPQVKLPLQDFQYIEDSEIESEDNSPVSITHPFDPKKVLITTRSPTISLICERIEEGEIDLNTEFQRSTDVWDKAKQSRLIESILIRLPLPAFYFDGTDDDNWLIVDGLQRLTCFNDFIVKDALELVDLEYLKEIEGKRFSELPRSFQRTIKATQLTAFVIDPGTPANLKYNIFKRINTGGMVLEPQEIRHALNQGIPANFVSLLAQNKFFLQATSHKISVKRMADREFVNRFIAFYLLGEENYQPDMDTFLQSGMRELYDLEPVQLTKIESDFNDAMKLSIAIFKEWAFRKTTNYPSRKGPINKALFESLSVSLARLSEKEKKWVADNSELIFQRFVGRLNNDVKFFDSISNATNEPRNVLIRFKALADILGENGAD